MIVRGKAVEKSCGVSHAIPGTRLMITSEVIEVKEIWETEEEIDGVKQQIVYPAVRVAIEVDDQKLEIWVPQEEIKQVLTPLEYSQYLALNYGE